MTPQSIVEFRVFNANGGQLIGEAKEVNYNKNKSELFLFLSLSLSFSHFSNIFSFFQSFAHLILKTTTSTPTTTPRTTVKETEQIGCGRCGMGLDNDSNKCLKCDQWFCLKCQTGSLSDD